MCIPILKDDPGEPEKDGVGKGLLVFFVSSKRAVDISGAILTGKQCRRDHGARVAQSQLRVDSQNETAERGVRVVIDKVLAKVSLLRNR